MRSDCEKRPKILRNFLIERPPRQKNVLFSTKITQTVFPSQLLSISEFAGFHEYSKYMTFFVGDFCHFPVFQTILFSQPVAGDQSNDSLMVIIVTSLIFFAKFCGVVD